MPPPNPLFDVVIAAHRTRETQAESAFDLQQARQTWASDEEVQLDLHELAGASVRALHGFGAGGNRATCDMLRELANMAPNLLAQAPAMSPAQTREILAFLCPEKGQGALHSARRRWPQALAAAGFWDFSMGPEAAFSQAARVGARWLAASHPDFRCGESSMATPESAALVDEGSRRVCQSALEALFRFGAELGLRGALESFQEIAADELQKDRSANSWPLSQRARRGLPAPLGAQELNAYAERVWLGMCAPAPEPRPRPRM